MRMELERVKYMFKDYLRTRIWKIEKNLMYVIEADKAELLSEPEVDYAYSLYVAKKDLFNKKLFSEGKLPEKLNMFKDD